MYSIISKKFPLLRPLAAREVAASIRAFQSVEDILGFLPQVAPCFTLPVTLSDKDDLETLYSFAARRTDITLLAAVTALAMSFGSQLYGATEISNNNAIRFKYTYFIN